MGGGRRMGTEGRGRGGEMRVSFAFRCLGRLYVSFGSANSLKCAWETNRTLPDFLKNPIPDIYRRRAAAVNGTNGHHAAPRSAIHLNGVGGAVAPIAVEGAEEGGEGTGTEGGQA